MTRNWFWTRTHGANTARWAAAILLSLTITLAAIFLTLGIADSIYISKNPIALEEADLGYGLVMVGVLCLSLAGAIPVFGVLIWRIRKFMSRKTNEGV